MRRKWRIAGLASGLAWVIALAPAAVQAQGAVTDHVLILSLDGMRPDALERFGTGMLAVLRAQGATDLRARTVHPSVTLPAHISMLTGVVPGRHGVTWNANRIRSDRPLAVPTVFELAGERGLSTAAFVSKMKLHHIRRPGSPDVLEGPSGARRLWLAEQTMDRAIPHMERERPNLMFIHIGEADYAGHTAGWMSDAYNFAIRRVDAVVTHIIQAADQAYGPGNYTVIVTSDHGGQGKDHGSRDHEDMRIPWIAWGEGVVHTTLEGEVHVYDTAATALWLLGVPIPEDWQGEPVVEAFGADARSAAEGANPGSRNES